MTSRLRTEAEKQKHPTPLRAVKGIVPHPDPHYARLGLTVVLLECGHTVRRALDMYGERFPSRRRCRECRDTSGDCPVLPIRQLGDEA